MIKNNISIYLLVVLLCLASGCKKDIIEEDINITSPLTTNTVLSSVVGLVNDESGSPLAGVTVSLRGEEVLTDQNGYFKFDAVKTSSLSGGYITFKKSGYFENFKFHYATVAGDQSFLRVTMLNLGEPDVVDANTGGWVSTNPETFTIGFPEAAFVDESGNAYSGQVNVHSKWINPIGNELTTQMPGDLRAEDASESLVQLSTFGMVAVELRGEAGQELNLASSKTATLAMAIPDVLKSSIPDSIQTWSFEEQSGYWVEESHAVPDETSTFYRTEVSHFSYWNYDAPWPIIEWCALLTYPDGSPVANTEVVIRIADSGVAKSGWTNNRGKVSGSLPKDQLLTLELLSDACGGDYFSMDIGPYADDENIRITVPFPEEAELINCQGTLTCDGAPVSNGYVLITNNNFVSQVAPTDVNGNYNLDILTCGLTKLTVQGFDLENQMVADAENFDEPVTPLVVDQETCTGETIDEYINYFINGELNAISDPVARIVNGQLQFTGSQGLLNQCWDDNGNGVQDASEDGDGNGLVDEFDCGSPEIKISVPDVLDGFNERISIIITEDGRTSWSSGTGMVNVTITDMGTNVGDYVEGNFSGSMSLDPNVEDATISGEFRIKILSIDIVYNIQGDVWLDENDNSFRDQNESLALNLNFNVTLRDVMGSILKIARTSNGDYSFGWLEPGSYSIASDLPAQYEQVSANIGNDDCADSDIDPTTNFSELIIISDEDVDCIDIGLRRVMLPCAEVVNPDNICNPGSGEVEFNVELSSPDSRENTLILDGVIVDTFSGTQYILSDIAAGTYSYNISDEFEVLCEGNFEIPLDDTADVVPCELLTDYTCGSPELVLQVQEIDCEGFNFSDIDSYLWSDGSTALDLNTDADGFYTLTVTNSNGCTGIAELEVDFSNYKDINGYVWEDDPAGTDGLFQSGETRLEGLIVDLFEEGNNTLLQSAMTNASGAYTFQDLDRNTTYLISLQNLADNREYSPSGVGGEVQSYNSVDPISGFAEVELSGCDIEFNNNVNIGIREK